MENDVTVVYSSSIFTLTAEIKFKKRVEDVWASGGQQAAKCSTPQGFILFSPIAPSKIDNAFICCLYTPFNQLPNTGGGHTKHFRGRTYLTSTSEREFTASQGLYRLAPATASFFYFLNKVA
jgi:hypothetical protein